MKISFPFTSSTNNFNPSLKPSRLDLNHWLALFDKFLTSGNQKDVVGSYNKLLTQQSKLQKIRRTRADKNWRKFARY